MSLMAVGPARVPALPCGVARYYAIAHREEAREMIGTLETARLAPPGLRRTREQVLAW